MSSSWNRFAGLSQPSRQRQHWDEELEIDFSLLGLPCTIFSDPHTAQFIDEGNHLQPWCGDESATMDRFDCRLLLDSQRQLKLKQTSTLHGLEDGGERMADELWAERYGDLESAMRAQEEEERGVSLKEGDGKIELE